MNTLFLKIQNWFEIWNLPVWSAPASALQQFDLSLGHILVTIKNDGVDSNDYDYIGDAIDGDGWVVMVMKVMVLMVNTTTSILALTWLDTLPWQAGPNCGRASPSDEDYIEDTNTEDDYIAHKNTKGKKQKKSKKK